MLYLYVFLVRLMLVKMSFINFHTELVKGKIRCKCL